MASGGFGSDNDSKVAKEGVRNEGTREAAYVGVWTKAVCRKTLKSSNERDRWRKRNSDELRQIQLATGAPL